MTITQLDIYEHDFFRNARSFQRENVLRAYKTYGRTPRFLFNAVSSGFEFANMNQKLIDTTLSPPIQCQKRCSFCCSIPISISAPEIVCIAENLYKAGESKDVIKKLNDVNSRIKGYNLIQHINAKIPCALLNNYGECSIYKQRPLVCRGWFSYSRKACEISAQDPLSHTTPTDFPSRAMVHAVIDGLIAGLSELGLDTKFYEFHSALLKALKTENVSERYLSGEDIFAGCKSYSDEAQGDTKMASDASKKINSDSIQ